MIEDPGDLFFLEQLLCGFQSSGVKSADHRLPDFEEELPHWNPS